MKECVHSTNVYVAVHPQMTKSFSSPLFFKPHKKVKISTITNQEGILGFVFLSREQHSDDSNGMFRQKAVKVSRLM